MPFTPADLLEIDCQTVGEVSTIPDASPFGNNGGLGVAQADEIAELNGGPGGQYVHAYDGAALMGFVDWITLDFEVASAGTISFWMKRTASVTDKLFDHSTGTSHLGIASTNEFTLVDVADNLCTGSLISDTDWHHYVLTNNGLDLTLYIDGVSEGTLSQQVQDDYIFDQIGKETEALFCGIQVGSTVWSAQDIADSYALGSDSGSTATGRCGINLGIQLSL